MKTKANKEGRKRPLNAKKGKIGMGIYAARAASSIRMYDGEYWIPVSVVQQLLDLILDE